MAVKGRIQKAERTLSRQVEVLGRQVSRAESKLDSLAIDKELGRELFSIADVLEGVIEVGAQGPASLCRELLLKLVAVPGRHVAGAMDVRVVSGTGLERDVVQALTRDLGPIVRRDVQVHRFGLHHPVLPRHADSDFALGLRAVPFREVAYWCPLRCLLGLWPLELADGDATSINLQKNTVHALTVTDRIHHLVPTSLPSLLQKLDRLFANSVSATFDQCAVNGMVMLLLHLLGRASKAHLGRQSGHGSLQASGGHAGL